MAPEIRGDPPARHPADLGRDDLDHGEQREAQRKGPRKLVAELRTDLAVRTNAAGIVVGGARNQPWAKPRQETAVLLFGQITPLCA
jgi:hypothetical protein